MGVSSVKNSGADAEAVGCTKAETDDIGQKGGHHMISAQKARKSMTVLSIPMAPKAAGRRTRCVITDRLRSNIMTGDPRTAEMGSRRARAVRAH